VRRLRRALPRAAGGARRLTPPRVGIVGARRARQGLGPFVARDLAAAGAEVPCFLATSEATRAPAARALREIAGVEARGYLALDAMLASERLDALAILSPHESHARYLAAAAEAGLHALCEKPLVWGLPDAFARAAALVAGFTSRGLLLVENCQWPHALPAFEALHPGALARPPRRFAMWLQPASLGRDALADSLSHPISLLQTLLPGEPRVRELAFSTRDPQASRIELRFRWESAAGSCEASVQLEYAERQPRRAEIELDGRRARRLVAPEGYRLSFADAERSVPLPDPLTRLVADFVGALRSGGAATQQDVILQRNRVLAEIAAAYAHEEIP
jgi:predicted dehydrogenase